MRHPTTGLSEGDLSRLTDSSPSTSTVDNDNINNNGALSSTTSPPTSKPIQTNFTEKELYETLSSPMSAEKSDTLSSQLLTSLKPSDHTMAEIVGSKCTYLPDLITPLDWQKSRKRKERLDSSSSSTQDRKLQRSNSEELVPTQTNSSESNDYVQRAGAISNSPRLFRKPLTDVIRRVCSEDFKNAAYLEKELNELSGKELNSKPSNENDKRNEARAADETISTVRQHQQIGAFTNKEIFLKSSLTKEIARRPRLDTSPARSQPFCTVISNVNNNVHLENSQNTSSNKPRDSDESECENERRRSSERFCKARVAPGRKSAGVVKKGGNFVFGTSKPNSTRLCDENVYKYDLSSIKYERRGFISKKKFSNEKEKHVGDLNDNLIHFHQQQMDLKNKKHSTPFQAITTEDNDNTCLGPRPTRVINIPVISTPQESLPWDRSVPEDHTPVLSRQHIFASSQCDQSEENLSKVMSYPYNTLNSTSNFSVLESDSENCIQTAEGFRVFTSLENFHTNEIMQQELLSFQPPEERMKQINKRLNAMKKKLLQLELAFVYRNGYRPSQVDRFNDKYIRNTLSELNKLRMERHDVKSNVTAALGFKSGSIFHTAIKLENIKETLTEIEKNLAEKRTLVQRPESLDELTADQLVEEKTSLQHALLYLESLYGRPATKEERDAVRPLYDRYRQLKRMVSRSVVVSVGAGISDLPTILEHEAMVFQQSYLQHSSNNSTETTNSPSDSTVLSISTDDLSPLTLANTKTSTTISNDNSDSNENIASMTIDQLWVYLDRTREEKNILKRTIREYETCFEQENGRKMLKNDRRNIEETYSKYKEKKAKTRLLQALIKKHISR